MVNQELLDKKRYKSLWDWKFHLVNKYLLIVEPTAEEKLLTNPERGSGSKEYYYYCKVMDDIKDNYSGPNPLYYKEKNRSHLFKLIISQIKSNKFLSIGFYSCLYYLNLINSIT